MNYILMKGIHYMKYLKNYIFQDINYVNYKNIYDEYYLFVLNLSKISDKAYLSFLIKYTMTPRRFPSTL